ITCRLPTEHLTEAARDLSAAEELLRFAHHPSSSASAQQTAVASPAADLLCEERGNMEPAPEPDRSPGLLADTSVVAENTMASPASGSAALLAQPGDVVGSIDDMLLDLPEFLRNGVPNIPDPFTAAGNTSQQYGMWAPRGLIGFGLDSNLELDDVDLGFLDAYSINVPFDFESTEGSATLPMERADEESMPQSGVSIRTEAYRKSIWRFIPVSQDCGGAEQQNLSLPTEMDASESPELRIKVGRRSTGGRMAQTSRDKILALVLSTCKPANVTRIVAAFPSLELLNILLQYYLTSTSCNAQSWLHMSTLSLDSMRPELLTVLIAAGAVMTPDTSIRKLGYALQEALRTYIPSRWEEDNSGTRDLQMLQAYGLNLEIGLWSGNSRKIELAESFLQPLVTMLRRGGKFRHSAYTVSGPHAQDHGPVLEEKWKLWIEQEQYVRLVFRTFQHDAQMSMALLTSPLISYAELLLPLPDVQDLWFATSADSWKAMCLSRSGAFNKRPTLVDCANDVDQLCSSGHLIDTEAASLAVLYAEWGLVWEYRQLSHFTEAQPQQALVITSRHQELVQALKHFRISCDGLAYGIDGTLSLILETVLMHLHMSLEDVQLFAGLEGQGEAYRVYPSLRDWVKTSAARQAVWHASQVIRAAKSLPPCSIRDFRAVALYHASLACWAYGLIRVAEQRPRSSMQAPQQDQTVWLDDTETTAVQRFIGLDRGLPCLHDSPSETSRVSSAFLSDPSAVMELIIGILQDNHKTDSGSKPPLVENLIQLMGGLQTAAKGSIS
ncbi:hypothetical protein LTR66_000561, partial [Elasticomyces elasticus]